MLTRDQLLERVWGYTFAGDTRTVDVHVRQLRRKLGDASPIVTVWGVGYKVSPAKESVSASAEQEGACSTRFVSGFPALFLAAIVIAGLDLDDHRLPAVPGLHARRVSSPSCEREAGGLADVYADQALQAIDEGRRGAASRRRRGSSAATGDRLFYCRTSTSSQAPRADSGSRALRPCRGLTTGAKGP